jgi:ABC-type nitrate/sulfonate/bicarbonate transport system ATPase subunit
MLRVEDLSKAYRTKAGPLEVLRALSFSVENEFVSLIGPSGSGKSTLIHILGGFLMPDSGTVTFDGVRVCKPGSQRAVIFQEDAVFPWMTVRQNAESGPRFRGADRKERTALAYEYLKLVDLAEVADFWPKQLSGGMRKRVELARAYAARSQCLLMDEPFGALDIITRRTMQHGLSALWQREPKPVVFVTHDVEEALFLSDRILVMSKKPAGILKAVVVPFARPRVDALRREPKFLELRYELENALDTSPAKPC